MVLLLDANALVVVDPVSATGERAFGYAAVTVSFSSKREMSENAEKERHNHVQRACTKSDLRDRLGADTDFLSPKNRKIITGIRQNRQR